MRPGPNALGMSDDEDDLWTFFEEEGDNVGSEQMSANLLNELGVESNHVLHEGDPDEGRITWVPPPVRLAGSEPTPSETTYV